MSAKDPNMKVIIGADTKDFDKGAKSVKQGLNDLDKTGNQALSALGEAFGVNTGKIGQMVSAIKGLGTKMSEAGSAGVSAFGKILAAIGPVGGAIAGLGIGAAIAGFRSLKEEAEAFKNTVEGANIEMATAAYIGTYKQVLNDFRFDSQKAIAETESRMKGFWGTLGASFKAYLATGGLAAAEVPGASADNYLDQISAAADKGEKARTITNQIYELERKRKEQAVDLAKINDEIADQMLIARDTSKSTSERQSAILQIETLIAQKKTMTVDLEKQLAALYSERSGLARDDVNAADATLAQEARVHEVERAIKQEGQSLLRIKNSVYNLTEKETAALQKQQAIIEKENLTMLQYLAKRIEMNDTQAVFSNLPTLQGMAVAPMMLSQKTVDEFKSRLVAEMGEITLYVGFKTDTQKIQDITNEVTSLLQSGVARTGEIIGNLIGTLAGGGDAWGDFKNAALSAFGDLAIAIGKIAIQAGIAASGISAILKSPDKWYLAVAAGAALVALGSAVKSSLSSVASGDYSASAGGYSSGGYSSGGGGDYETREVKVYVTGTLEADGDKLITVINNTNKKNYYTQ